MKKTAKLIRRRKSAKFPQRYKVRRGEQDTVICLETQNIAAVVERGLGFSSGNARKAEGNTIFLDGVASCAPFLDHEKQIYNLDHHEGCIRSFTIATCEQAMLLVMKGLDLRSGEWRVYANDPDLDTVFAVWVILNHSYLQRPEIRQKIMPLIRMEGIIDAHGLEFLDFSGFSKGTREAALAAIGELHDEEIGIKKKGMWTKIDFPDYIQSVLYRIDRMVFDADAFTDFQTVEELMRVQLTSDRDAVLCRSKLGVYELEKHLGKLYGDSIGILVLEKASGVFTLRQTDMFLHSNMEKVYPLLNTLDPAVNGFRKENFWNGAGDIGGSPRVSGSGLSGAEIITAIQEAFFRPTLSEKLMAIVNPLGVFAVIMLLSIAVPVMMYLPLHLFHVLNNAAVYAVSIQGLFAGGILFFSSAYLFIANHRHPRRFGLRVPGGIDHIFFLPLIIIGALFGGIWLPDVKALWSSHWMSQIFHILIYSLAAEVFFRSLLHGLFSRHLPSQYVGGPWFISRPAIFSAALYAVVTALPLSAFAAPVTPLTYLPLASGIRFIAAAVSGLGLAMVRERSQSLFTPFFYHFGIAVFLVLAR